MAAKRGRKSTAEKYNYAIEYVIESINGRQSLLPYYKRSRQAYEGYPSNNNYADRLRTYADEIFSHDRIRGQEVKRRCEEAPRVKSQIVLNAVDSVVAQTMGGVGRFDVEPYDPGFAHESGLIDKMASFIGFTFDDQKMNSLVPRYIRNSILDGASYVYLKPKKDKKRIEISMIPAIDMLNDPNRAVTNYARFRGHTQRISFAKIKSRVKQSKKGVQIKTVDGVEHYLGDIRNHINGNKTDYYDEEAIKRHVDLFYRSTYDTVQAAKETDKDYGYQGDDVELAVLYDYENNMYFEIINRKFIIVARSNPLRKKVGKGENARICELNDPYVELPKLIQEWSTYPVSELFYLLEEFDRVCAIESVLYHNLSIMAPITFQGQSSDGEKMARMASVPGEFVEGLPQTVSVMNKTHDLSPCIAAIQRFEDKIKRTLGATDAYELSSMIGDRAKAKETSALTGQVALKHNPFMANIEDAMTEIGNKLIAMKVIFSDKDEFEFPHKGKTSTISAEEATRMYKVRAKLQSSVQMEQDTQARRAIELVGIAQNIPQVNLEEFLPDMFRIALQRTVSRQRAEAYVTPAEAPAPVNQLEGVDLDAAAAQLNLASQSLPPQQLAQAGPNPLAGLPTGQTPDFAGELANENALQSGAPEDRNFNG